MDETLLLTLRAMAWQRAKAELLSYLHTYWPKYSRSGERIDNGFDEANARIETFIKDFEDNQ